MRRFKTKKDVDLRLLIICIIFFLTFTLYVNISKNFSGGLVSLTEKMVKQNLTKSLSDNFKLSILKNYDVDNLIIIKYGDNNEISDVDFRINDAYNLASEICNELKISKFEYKSNLINIIEKDEQNIIMQVPIYYYLRNPIMSNIGPKQIVKLNYIRDFLYEIKVMVNNYGINSLHIELYLNLKIGSQVFFYENKNFSTEYSILLSSKIVNGKIPSFYGSSFEKNTGFLNI